MQVEVTNKFWGQLENLMNMLDYRMSGICSKIQHVQEGDILRELGKVHYLWQEMEDEEN
jgi:hypothetical protein